MKFPKIDKRDSKDILESIRSLAKSYAPEWQVDYSNPDFGSVLAIIFADMMENTISLYNRVPYNYYLEFLNLVGVKRLPPVSSCGMITAAISDASDGVYIKENTQLYAVADTDDGKVYFRTLENMYAIGTEVVAVYATDFSKDRIVCLYSKGDEGFTPFRAFDTIGNDNLQEHIIYFYEDEVFYSHGSADISINIKNNRYKHTDDYIKDIFLDNNNISFEYYYCGEWVKISNIEYEGGNIRLRTETPIHMYNYLEKEALYIRCIFNRLPKGRVHITDISFSSCGNGLSPEAVFSGTTELASLGFYPFGEEFSLFNDFYILSDEVFCKRGANISMAINSQFVRVKREYVETADNIRYKFFMQKSDFEKPEPSDIEISNVIWEYWNGLGWARLYKDKTNEDFFVPDTAGSVNRVLNFVCPNDIERTSVGAREGYFIRCRLTRIKNSLQQDAVFITPYVHDICISYAYNEHGVACSSVYTVSDCRSGVYNLPSLDYSPLLSTDICTKPAMYFALSKPIEHGPVRVFMDIDAGLLKDRPALKWEYYSTDTGCRWKSIEVMDLTCNFSCGAIVTMIGKRDFALASFFSKEAYYIRIVNSGGEYEAIDSYDKLPIIKGIYFNTVPIGQFITPDAEFFSINSMEQGKICNLSAENIVSVRVWVNELGSISSLQEENFLKDDDVVKEYNDNGELIALWVEWQEIEHIGAASFNDRVFETDNIKGIVFFGDGINGKIPTSKTVDSIKIEYKASNGRMGNIDSYDIQGFSDSIQGIENVYNLRPVIGGVDVETTEQAAGRMSNRLCGMNRLVSLDDFEGAIKASNRNICRVKCIPHADHLNNKHRGMISISILPYNYRQGFERFAIIKKDVEEFVREKSSMLISSLNVFNIMEAMYVEMAVSLEIVIDNYNLYHDVHKEIINRLKPFLDPITGNFDGNGYEIGELPTEEIIHNYIKSIKHVRRIKRVTIFPRVETETGIKDVDLQEIRKNKFVLPVYVEPFIDMSVD